MIELRAEESKIVFLAMEQTWLDEDTALKAAASKGVGGSSPSCSATFPRYNRAKRDIHISIGSALSFHEVTGRPYLDRPFQP